MDYPLTQLYPGSRDVRITRGVFCVPLRGDRRIALAKRSYESSSSPGVWHCIGGNVRPEECVLEHTLGRELTVESRGSIRKVVGRIGRPLDMVRIPAEEDEEVQVDIAELFFVRTNGRLQLTDESWQIEWFNASEFLQLQELEPLSRMGRFAFWAASMADKPIWFGRGASVVEEILQVSLLPAATFQLVHNDSLFVHCRMDGLGDVHVRVWDNKQPGIPRDMVLDIHRRLAEIV